jgi:hypothetical protein
LEANREAFQIIKSIDFATAERDERSPNTFAFLLALLSFSSLRRKCALRPDFQEGSGLLKDSLQLWYFGCGLLFYNLLVEGHDAMAQSIFLFISGPIVSFASTHFPLSFLVLRSGIRRPFVAACSIAFCLQSLVWSLMIVGAFPGASGGLLGAIGSLAQFAWMPFTLIAINVLFATLFLFYSAKLTIRIIKLLAPNHSC